MRAEVLKGHSYLTEEMVNNMELPLLEAHVRALKNSVDYSARGGGTTGNAKEEVRRHTPILLAEPNKPEGGKE